MDRRRIRNAVLSLDKAAISTSLRASDRWRLDGWEGWDSEGGAGEAGLRAVVRRGGMVIGLVLVL